MRASRWARLKRLIPQTWVIDSAPVPHHAVIPSLEIQDWRELKKFSQKQREFVLKVSGFSELAWGSRGVYVGQDLPQREWAESVDQAIASFHDGPFILQRFFKGRLVRHPYYDPATNSLETLIGRVRLCPYYFVISENEVRLGGALATIVPADKKIVHGMRDAVMVPTAIELGDGEAESSRLGTTMTIAHEAHGGEGSHLLPGNTILARDLNFAFFIDRVCNSLDHAHVLDPLRKTGLRLMLAGDRQAAIKSSSTRQCCSSSGGISISAALFSPSLPP